jgi:hypothetical protein
VSTITCYRIDYRDLAEGEIIVSPGDHYDQLDDTLAAAEERLRAVSEEKRSLRATSLYVFPDVVRAKRYFMGKKGALYEVQVDESDILHEADMMLVNRIAAAANEDEDEAAACIARYWAKDKGSGESIEFLVSSAVVTRRLFTAHDKVRLKNELYPNSVPVEDDASNTRVDLEHRSTNIARDH